jgi:hypothetical protein
MSSALRDFPESQAAEENLTQAYPMAPGWHTRSSTGEPGELRYIEDMDGLRLAGSFRTIREASKESSEVPARFSEESNPGW